MSKCSQIQEICKLAENNVNDVFLVLFKYKNQEFIGAVKSIIKNREIFSKNALHLAEKYNYRKLYPKIFA